MLLSESESSDEVNFFTEVLFVSEPEFFGRFVFSFVTLAVFSFVTLAVLFTNS